MDSIVLYSDGGSRNTGNRKGQHVKNFNRSAWAYLAILPDEKACLPSTQAYFGHTNNQMELAGVIFGLSSIINYSVDKVNSDYVKTPVIVVSDSKYVDNAFNKGWINNWRANEFHGIANSGYWKVLDSLLRNFDSVKFHWVKGHAHCRGNICVDHMLNRAMDNLTDIKIMILKQMDNDDYLVLKESLHKNGSFPYTVVRYNRHQIYCDAWTHWTKGTLQDDIRHVPRLKQMLRKYPNRQFVNWYKLLPHDIDMKTKPVYHNK